jgi:hypothetical protein
LDHGYTKLKLEDYQMNLQVKYSRSQEEEQGKQEEQGEQREKN